MRTKVFKLLAFCLLCISIHAQQRIIGGSAVDISQRPYQAAIFIDGQFAAGGVIINNQCEKKCFPLQLTLPPRRVNCRGFKS